MLTLLRILVVLCIAVNDAMDDIMADSGDEEKSSAIVSQVLDEIGIEVSDKVRMTRHAKLLLHILLMDFSLYVKCGFGGPSANFVLSSIAAIKNSWLCKILFVTQRVRADSNRNTRASASLFCFVRPPLDERPPTLVEAIFSVVSSFFFFFLFLWLFPSYRVACITDDLSSPHRPVRRLARSQSSTFQISLTRVFPSCFRSSSLPLTW